MSIQSGQIAPDLSLPDQHNTIHTLSENKGRWVLLYFYPKDETPGCTTEACSIRDNYEKFTKEGIVIWGINTDSVESHKKFAEHHHLPFPLLADEEKKVVTLYGVYHHHQFMGLPGVMRMSFLISPTGEIVKIYEKVNPSEHVEQILSDFRSFQ